MMNRREELNAEMMEQVNGGLIKLYTEGDELFYEILADEAPHKHLAAASINVRDTLNLFRNMDEKAAWAKEYCLVHGLSSELAPIVPDDTYAIIAPSFFKS